MTDPSPSHRGAPGGPGGVPGGSQGGPEGDPGGVPGVSRDLRDAILEPFWDYFPFFFYRWKQQKP